MAATGLSRALGLSVAYDLVAFVLLLWMPPWLLDAFDHPPPAAPFLFRLSALPLLLLPVVYAMAAKDPLGRPQLTRAAFRLRLLGGISIAALVLWQRPAVPMPYLLFAIGDFAWAGIYSIAARGTGLSLGGRGESAVDG